MKYRNTELLDAEDVGPAGTKVIDLNVTEPISRIEIGFKTTKSKHGMDSYAHRDISKIELVDGSDVLHSLDGGENQALCIYDRRVRTMSHGQHVNGCSEYQVFGIDFGRFLWDPLLAFLPSRFRNPQLKITYDEDVADTGVTANTLEVWAHLFDEKVISPIGFLTAKEHYAYTCGSENSYEYIDLPTDYPLRKLLIQGYLTAKEPWAQVKEARLSEDNMKRIPFDWDLEAYYRLMKGADFGLVEEQFYGYIEGGSTNFYVTPTDYFACLVGLPQTGPVKAVMGMPGGYITLESATDPDILLGRAAGYLPNHCFCFPFGDQKDVEDWYDVIKLGSLRLRLKAGSSGASGTAAVVTQQLRRY